jgi:hypothetical protein
VTAYPLTVSVTGKGTVRSSSGIDCTGSGPTCSINPAAGSTLTLTATPAEGETFNGWSGPCTGKAQSCTFSISGPTTVAAVFSGGAAATPGTLTLDVVGRGTVQAHGGTCTGTGTSKKTCTQHYTAGETVTLTEKPAKGAVFGGWTGACKGKQATCSVKLTTPLAVTATFAGPATPFQASGTPVVKRTGNRFMVTLPYEATQAGTGSLRVLRGKRLVSSSSYPLKTGRGSIGPITVTGPGSYTFEVAFTGSGKGRPKSNAHWTACLGSC